MTAPKPKPFEEWTFRMHASCVWWFLRTYRLKCVFADLDREWKLEMIATWYDGPIYQLWFGPFVLCVATP